jgi:hypothetical protein
MNCRLINTPAIPHMTSTAVGQAAHAMAPRKPTRARIEMVSATRGRREERAKKK